MSLDVDLIGEPVEEDCTCECCQHLHKRKVTPTFYSDNITHNLSVMAGECGLYDALWHPDAIQATKASHLIPFLERGITLLKSDPERFKQFAPKNGWGSYSGLLSFAQSYLDACRSYPSATIEVSR